MRCLDAVKASIPVAQVDGHFSVFVARVQSVAEACYRTGFAGQLWPQSLQDDMALFTNPVVYLCFAPFRVRADSRVHPIGSNNRIADEVNQGLGARYAGLG